jgi:diguanylate cyclase (GGDEF)-like protein/PAS domain S-box-containing protein
MLTAVTPVWNRIAGDLPSRLRFTLLAFAGVLVASNVPFVFLSSEPLWSRVTLGVLYAIVLVRWTLWTRGGRPVPADLVVELAALVLSTVVMNDPSATASFLYAGVIIRAYYSSTRQLVWWLTLYNVLFLASVLLAPNTDHSLMAPNVLSQPPTAIVAAGVIAWFSRTVQQHHRLMAEHRLQVALQSDLLTEVKAGHRRFRSLVEALPGAILTSTPTGEVRYVSPQADQLLGAPAAELQTSWPDLISRFVAPDDQQRVFAAAGAAVATGAAWSMEFRVIKPTGELIWLQLDSVLVDDGSPDSPLWQSLAFDVTERHRLTEQLTHQAFHDALTGLPNRLQFKEQITVALERTTRDGAIPAVCFIDLDDFKTVNDTLGHLMGDRLIVEAASRLRQSVREGDVVARLGGDEFALLLEMPRGQADIIRIVERIVSDFDQPFLLDGHTIVTGASVGIATVDRPGLSRTELIRRADVAMYAAKAAGKGRYAIYDAAMMADAGQRSDLERELAHALANDELCITYQPIVDLDSGTIQAVEALLRWQHPVRGLLGPDAFLAALEDSGLIVPVGHWMLERACQHLSQWRRSVPAAGDLMLSLNLSPRQLRDPRLVETVSHVLATSGIAANQLQLEISERTMLADGEAAMPALAELSTIGVQIAIDDFGTGNASLGHLRQLPVQMLKVDRSYVDASGRSEHSTTMLRAMVTLGKTLGMEVTAEGIETIDQTALRALGCDYGQGFYFARPLLVDEMTALLAERVVYPLAESQLMLVAGSADPFARRDAG